MTSRHCAQQADIVVASCHWGLHKEVLAYMREIGHAAIDAGADLVIGHGPHYSLPVEVYRGKAIFYGLGSFSFHTGHGGRRHGDWIGMMVRATITDRAIADVGFQFVRHNDRNETVPCRLAEEAAELDDIANTQRALWDPADRARRRSGDWAAGGGRRLADPASRQPCAAAAIFALGRRIQIDVRENAMSPLRRDRTVRALPFDGEPSFGKT